MPDDLKDKRWGRFMDKLNAGLDYSVLLDEESKQDKKWQRSFKIFKKERCRW